MPLRIANITDLDKITDMAMKFAKSTNYENYADEETVRKFASAILSSDGRSAICLIHEDDGFIAGMVAPFTFGTKRLATELAWWVTPDKRKSDVGKQLLEAFEHWAKLAQCDGIVMVSLDDNLGKFYEK